MSSIKKETTEIGWQDLLDPVPIEPDGYSTLPQIAKRLNIAPNTVKIKLEKLGVKKIRAKLSTGQHAWFYKD